MEIEATDCAGNRCRKAVMRFEVMATFDIINLGNYPNPFSDYTIFTYVLTSELVKDFSIKIYSVDGRLVRVFRDFNDDAGNPAISPGYHEVTWDGTDDTGLELANGVYFCRVRAVSEKGKVVEKIMKVAKRR